MRKSARLHSLFFPARNPGAASCRPPPLLQRLPTGFTETLVANGLSNPTAFAFAPDGRHITAPANNTLYSAGDTISYSGTGTDPEDGTLAPSAFTWQVDFHYDTHTHPFVPATTGSTGGSFTIPRTGETLPTSGTAST